MDAAAAMSVSPRFGPLELATQRAHAEDDITAEELVYVPYLNGDGPGREFELLLASMRTPTQQRETSFVRSRASIDCKSTSYKR
jgi:hypothetical protein